jgi:hypothetical protein
VNNVRITYYHLHKPKQGEYKMDLTKEELTYGQQKNREHCWHQAKEEFKRVFGRIPRGDEEYLHTRYYQLCAQANLTAW